MNIHLRKFSNLYNMCMVQIQTSYLNSVFGLLHILATWRYKGSFRSHLCENIS